MYHQHPSFYGTPSHPYVINNSQDFAYNYASYYPYMGKDRRYLSSSEILWRLSWPYVFTLVLAILMLFFIISIFALEIVSLAIDDSNKLSNTASTGAGIWCSIFFIIPVIFMYLLVFVYDKSYIWSIYTLIAHLIALIFICILVGLDANAITPYNTMVSTAPMKIQVLRGQLAVAILMFFFPLAFIAAYIYTAFMSLLFHYHHSVHRSFPVSSSFAKY